jgi:hypothetical protein
MFAVGLISDFQSMATSILPPRIARSRGSNRAYLSLASLRSPQSRAAPYLAPAAVTVTIITTTLLARAREW